MTSLKKLTLTDRSQKRVTVDPVIRSRNKFSLAVQQQIDIVESEAKGETFTIERMRWKTNEDGERVKTPTQISPRPWFWEEEGIVYLIPKVGVRPMEIEKEKPTIKVGAKKDLVSTLKMLVEATEAGELDNQISEANGRKNSK